MPLSAPTSTIIEELRATKATLDAQLTTLRVNANGIDIFQAEGDEDDGEVEDECLRGDEDLPLEQSSLHAREVQLAEIMQKHYPIGVWAGPKDEDFVPFEGKRSVSAKATKDCEINPQWRAVWTQNGTPFWTRPLSRVSAQAAAGVGDLQSAFDAEHVMKEYGSRRVMSALATITGREGPERDGQMASTTPGSQVHARLAHPGRA